MGTALHCALLGWWSAHGFLFNLVLLPKNLIGAVALRAPAKPSTALVTMVMHRLGEANVGRYRALLEQEQQAATAAGAPAGSAAAALAQERMPMPEDAQNPYRAPG